MNQRLIALALLLLPLSASALDWKPTAEAGLVATSGNSDTLNVNARLAISGEDEKWLHDYYLLALRNETDDETTANRFEFGGRTLTRAIAKGFRDFKWMLRDPDLVQLRRDPIFKKIWVAISALQAGVH